jgi:hypothetical protein
MADNYSVAADTDYPDVDDERVLVRPYIDEYEYDQTEYEAEPTGDPPPVPPRPPARPGRHAIAAQHRRARTFVDGKPVSAKVSRGRWPYFLVTGGGVLVVAVAAVVLTIGAEGRSAGPRSDTPAAASALGDGSQPASPPNASATPDLPTPSASAGPSTGSAAGQPNGSAKPSRPRTPSPLLPIAPAAGRITSAAGLCLYGTVGNGDKILLGDCDGTDGQVWTIPGDGTIRTQGRCLHATAGPAKLRDCDGDAGQQWRSGPAGSLVNPGLGLCLGDPASATNQGTPQHMAPCDQSGSQRWTLPSPTA